MHVFVIRATGYGCHGRAHTSRHRVTQYRWEVGENAMRYCAGNLAFIPQAAFESFDGVRDCAGIYFSEPLELALGYYGLDNHESLRPDRCITIHSRIPAWKKNLFGP